MTRVTRDPDLVLDLSGAVHPSRRARTEMRRFLATRSVAMVEDAGMAVTEVVRRAGRAHSGSVCLRAWFDAPSRSLRVEIVEGGGEVDTTGLDVLSALSTSWGTASVDDGASVWFEMQPREMHDRRGRTS
jgi:hypothetical protein